MFSLLKHSFMQFRSTFWKTPQLKELRFRQQKPPSNALHAAFFLVSSKKTLQVGGLKGRLKDAMVGNRARARLALPPLRNDS